MLAPLNWNLMEQAAHRMMIDMKTMAAIPDDHIRFTLCAKLFFDAIVFYFSV